MICEHEKMNGDGDLVCTYYNDGMPCYVKDAWSPEDCEQFKQASIDDLDAVFGVYIKRCQVAIMNNDELELVRMHKIMVPVRNELVWLRKPK